MKREFLTVWITDPQEYPRDPGFYVPDVVHESDPDGTTRYMCRAAHIALWNGVAKQWVGFSRDYRSPCAYFRTHPAFSH